MTIVNNHKNLWHRIVSLLFIFHFSIFTSFAQIGTWKNYLAYHDIQQICAAGDYLFVRASNGLYQYNQKDQSITTFDRTNGLSDTSIKLIAWNKQVKRLIAVYENSNIDVIETNGNIINISALYSKTMTEDKTVNSIYIYGKYAYLACGFGIIKVNMADAEIAETYNLEENISAIGISNGTIYAKQQNQVVCASLTQNLIDPSNWTINTQYPSEIFNVDTSDYDTYYPIVSSLNPGGPIVNHFYEMKFLNNSLYTVAGLYSSFANLYYAGNIQVLSDDQWQIYQNNIESITGYKYEDIDCIDVDPLDNSHVFAGGRTGLYEFNNGQLIAFYNEENSPLVSAYSHGKYLGNNFLIIKGLTFDASGNLWVINNHSNKSSLFRLNKNKEWTNLDNQLLYDKGTGVSMHGMRQMMIDSRGLLWWVNDHWYYPCVICYDMDKEQAIVYNSIVNQDGTKYNVTSVKCIAEDFKGNIWIGTNLGPFYIKNNEIGNENITFVQEKIPRNDGTNYADYLLNSTDITCITIDAAGRKWFGTSNNGVYLISEDNMTQLHHFVSNESYLLSNSINSIAINNQSGEVFIATDKGLCSYVSNATTASDEMNKDNVYAYPNPVTPDYTGLITIVGLSLNSDVKILTSNGKLIAEGRSNGGTFTWDGCDQTGKHVASGIYMVAAATQEGKKGVVCKIAIIK